MDVGKDLWIRAIFSLKKLLKVFTRLIASEELRGGEGGDLCKMELAVFQKTFEFGLTDASMLLK